MLTRAVFVLAFLGLLAVLPAQHAQAQVAGLSYLQVVGVASPEFAGGREWERIPDNALGTPGNHGGDWLCVAVLETGSANRQYAVFNGERVAPYRSEPLWGSNRIQWGTMQYYFFSRPFTNGKLTFSSTSAVQPWGTRSGYLSIR